jgi:hypothetical protein
MQLPQNPIDCGMLYCKYWDRMVHVRFEDENHNGRTVMYTIRVPDKGPEYEREYFVDPSDISLAMCEDGSNYIDSYTPWLWNEREVRRMASLYLKYIPPNNREWYNTKWFTDMFYDVFCNTRGDTQAQA